MPMTDSPTRSVATAEEALASAMPEPKAKRPPKAKGKARAGRVEPLITAAVVFFLMAVAFAAAPAMKAGLTTIAGMLLLSAWRASRSSASSCSAARQRPRPGANPTPIS